MTRLFLSAFADEYASDFERQLIALKGFVIENVEIRGVNGKNVSLLSKEEVADVKRKLDDYGIGVSAIGSPLGKIRLDDTLPKKRLLPTPLRK